MESCCFVGHKDCPIEIKTRLSQTVEWLITDKQVKRFYVGTQGAFDRLVYEVLYELEKVYAIQVFVVLAYLNRKEESTYYDVNKTIFPDEITRTPLRFAIRRRNSFMIDKSQYIITYLDVSFSNTYTNVAEAVRKKKKIINLGTLDIDTI